MAMVLTLGIAMLAGAVFFAVDAVTLPVRQRRASIERATRLGGDGPRSSIELHSARERLLAPLGLGLDGAIAILNENMTGPLADEFALTLGEIRIGEGRQEALKKLSDRLDIPEISALTRAILQSDQLGISLGRILRTQARESRVRRQGAAEERANKLPVKIL